MEVQACESDQDAAACKRYEWDMLDSDIMIVGAKGSYYGDTGGVMDLGEPLTFNERVPFYRGPGYWFDFPQVKMVMGIWHVEPPVGVEEKFGSRTDAPHYWQFSMSRERMRALPVIYTSATLKLPWRGSSKRKAKPLAPSSWSS